MVIQIIDYTKISVLMKQNGFNNEDLAVRVGVSFQCISKWLNGATIPDAINFKRLEDVLGVPVNELYKKEVA